ncbi:HAD hydrolase-like protein [candidate division KSB1 bacterium]|nr:HAD hydrolase-like protein [candidate division KSB1 bacterium]
MTIKAMIFDLYGTLVDNFSREAYRENLAQMARLLQIPSEGFQKRWREIYVQRVLGFCKSPEDCIASACNAYNVKPGIDQIKQAEMLRWEFVRNSLKPREDTLSTLAALKASGLKIALLSDCSTEIPRLWEESAFAGVFDATTFSCTEFVKKPEPKIYFLTAEKLGVDPGECIFVGDGGSFELTGAARVGMHPIRIRDPRETEDSVRIDEDPWNGTTISTLSEILQHFDTLLAF